MLEALGKQLEFEIAVGENGGFWVKSGNGHEATTIIANAILNAEALPVEQHSHMVARLMETYLRRPRQSQPEDNMEVT